MKYLINEADRHLIQEFLHWYKQFRLNKTKQPQHFPMKAPEVYVAKTPEDGIPAAVTEEDVGTGTADITVPGSALCEIYKVLEVGTSDADEELIRVDNLEHRIYNVSEQTLLGPYVVVQRDKFGRWLAGASAGGGDGKVRIQPGDPLRYLKDQFRDLVNDVYNEDDDLEITVEAVLSDETGTAVGSGTEGDFALVAFVRRSTIPGQSPTGRRLLGTEDGVWRFFDGDGPCTPTTGTGV